ncbi:MAG: hypothetical protein N3H31_01690 [Candidatus Nezhaarchaeota archaeon]|nr:hypothetical protein [Candidatus Nezhaarchaeota archaeon]
MKPPWLMVGTSPFIGAGQFGGRALEYLQVFYGRPWRVAEVLTEALSSGAQAIQALSEWYIVEAVSKVRSMGWDVEVWASLPMRGVKEALASFAKVDAKAIAVHGSVVDSMNLRVISEQLSLVKEQGFKAGLALHTPARSLNWVLRTKLKVDFLMIPLNKLGVFMDAPPPKIHELASKVGVPVVAMKVLAAGLLSPAEGVGFILSLSPPPSMAIGVASVEEARRTFREASSLLAQAGLCEKL